MEVASGEGELISIEHSSIEIHSKTVRIEELSPPDTKSYQGYVRIFFQDGICSTSASYFGKYFAQPEAVAITEV